MKKITLIFIATIFCITTIAKEAKIGGVTVDELNLKYCPFDSTANAAVLYEKATIDINIEQSGINKTYTHFERLKIFNQDGIDHASYSLYSYHDGNEYSKITKIEGYSYRLENGKIIKEKLDKKNLYKEDIDDTYSVTKFSLPSVRENSVIELQVTMVSNIYYEIPPFRFQRSIPVYYSRYEVTYPEYFDFRVRGKGYHPLHTDKKVKTNALDYYNGTNSNALLFNSTTDIYIAENIPSLKDEEHLWNVNDHRLGIDYDLHSLNIPGRLTKEYSSTWENVKEKLIEYCEVEKVTQAKNIIGSKPEDIYGDANNDKEKIKRLYDYVISKFEWNHIYSLTNHSTSKIIKERGGNNIQINRVIAGLLNEAGYRVYPVAVKLRSKGKIGDFPSIKAFNTFVLAIEDGQGNTYYIDGSNQYGSFGTLPTNLMIPNALALDSKSTYAKLIDLSNYGKHKKNFNIASKIDENGKIVGTINCNAIGLEAANFRSVYSKKDSSSFVEKFEKEFNIEIDSLTVKGLKPSEDAVEWTISFTAQAEVVGDTIMYLQPIFIPVSSNNPFNATKRDYPVEFKYAKTIGYYAKTEMPEGWVVGTEPSNFLIKNNDNALSYRHSFAIDSNTLVTFYNYTMKRPIFSPDEYGQLHNMFAEMIYRNNDMVVLKKK